MEEDLSPKFYEPNAKPNLNSSSFNPRNFIMPIKEEGIIKLSKGGKHVKKEIILDRKKFL